MCKSAATILSVISLLIYTTEYALYVYVSNAASPKVTPLAVGSVLILVHIALVMTAAKMKRARWIFGVALGLASLIAVAYVALYLLISEASICLFGKCAIACGSVIIKYNPATLGVLAMLSVIPYVAIIILVILGARRDRSASLEAGGTQYTLLETTRS